MNSPVCHGISLTLLRSPEARAVFGNLPTSTFYEWIERGLMTPGVAIGIRSVAWPSHECQAIAAARIAGKSDTDIKTLVHELIIARSAMAVLSESVVVSASLRAGKSHSESVALVRDLNAPCSDFSKEVTA